LALFMLPIAAGIVENRHDSLTLMYPAIAFSLMILFILRRQSNEERRILAEHELAESKAKLFTEQLHPHFIFNSLTAIQELCMEDSTRARKAVQ
ncbi:histidine kinase, partial [Escherichia coli]